MRFLAAVEITSISIFHKKRLRFSLEITLGEKSHNTRLTAEQTNQITYHWLKISSQVMVLS
jgi:hypothetical protein